MRTSRPPEQSCRHRRPRSHRCRRRMRRDPHRGSYFIHKLLRSAVAGALEKNMPEDLVVSTARVDEGPTIKRFRPRAQGRATSIFKRTSHIIIGLKPKKGE